jgi:hypothetical protein
VSFASTSCAGGRVGVGSFVNGLRQVVHQRGITAASGLYFLGMPWQHTRGSALLGWVKDDAQYIADQIAKLARVPVDVPDDQPPRMATA